MTDVSQLKLLTTEELSAATGLPQWRIYELVRAGRAPRHMRVGATLRFPIDGVTEWIQQQCAEAER